MKLYVRYSKKRINTALANKIVKPFIVVEGYDITDASQLLKANNYSINSLIREWDKDEFLNTYDFNKKLDEEAGYDLIFIDYYTMRSLLENADYLMQAIDWINSQKVNNAVGVREQNIIMGISMGGLVSRYALAKRTKLTNTNSTETKELITMDSPHQGANVPLGLQHFLFDFGEARIVKKISDISDEIKAFYYLNDLPATREQLLLRVTDGNGGRVNNTFLLDGGIYRTMVDYNAPYPFYAISNGAQCAVPVMQPSTLLLKKDGNVASSNLLLFFYNNKYRLNIQANSLPAYGNQSQICSVVMQRNLRLFYGLIGTGWATTSNTPPRISPSNTIPWDGVPGGTKSTETTGPISQSSTTPTINQNNTFLGNAWRSIFFLLFNVSANIELPFSQKTFSFVPITSALDVQNVTASTFSQPFSFATNGLLGSRANKYISQDFTARSLFNIEHTDFTPRNSRWLYNEMQNLTQQVTCEDFCISSITGPSSFCTSATYSFALPLGSTVSWSVNNIVPAGSVTFQLSGNTIILTRVQNGQATITANTSSSCFASLTTVSKNVIFGGSYGGYFTTSLSSTPVPILIGGSTHTIIVPRGGTVNVNIQLTNLQNISNIKWYPNNSYFTSFGTGSSFTLSANASIYSYSNTNVSALLAANSPCGDISSIYGFNLQTLNARNAIIGDSLSNESFIATPNPVNDILNISVLIPVNKKVKGEYVIKISELNTLLQLRQLRITKTGKNFQINMAGLKTGYYAVEINDGENKQVLKIYKQ
jgi:PGAP1-like protein/Secretion system C-terminal sorting domain